MAARWVRFSYLSIEETRATADRLLLMDFGIAAIAIFVIGGMIGQKTLSHMAAQVCGIGVMMVLMHNLIWMLPAEFAQVYGQGYVEQVQSLTAPQSLYVGGEVFAITL